MGCQTVLANAEARGAGLRLSSALTEYSTHRFRCLVFIRAATAALAPLRPLHNIGNQQPFTGGITLPDPHVGAVLRSRAFDVNGAVAVAEVT
jgi:hypothetical protein